jgi:hypothetical protein
MTSHTTSREAVRIAEKYGMKDFDVTVSGRGNVSTPGFDLPENAPEVYTCHDLCVATVAHGFLDRKARRKHQQSLAQLLYDDIFDELMEIASFLARHDKLTSDVRGYSAAVRKCVYDDGVTPAACTELVLRALTPEELSTYFREC